MSENVNSSKQSAKSLSGELFDFCKGDSLSEKGLREIIERRHGFTPNDKLELTPNYNDECHRNSLHMACGNRRVTVGIIQRLLSCFPAAASATDSHGFVPLHYACSNRSATLNIIRLLVDAAPESVFSLSKHGSTPLHTLSENGVLDKATLLQILKLGLMPLQSLCSNRKVNETAAVQILKLLLDRHPEAVRHADNGGRLPIHSASGTKSPEFCRVLLEVYPGSEQVRDAYGRLPLHYACYKGNLSTVTYLYSLYPNGIKLATSNGRYPIHCAIDTPQRDYSGVDIVKFLLGCGPDVKLQEYRGMSLLHHFCQQEYDESNIEVGIQIIKVILDAHPTSLRCVDDFGRMPLHSLCNNRKVDQSAAVQILKLLLEKHPEAVRHTDNEGNLPIHSASEWRSMEFCRLLIRAYPGSERISARNGILPLHLACSRNTVDVVEYFCKLFPDAIEHATSERHYPIHYTIHHAIYRKDGSEAALDIVQYLLDYDPNVKLQKFKDMSLLHCACSAEYNDSNIEVGIQIIKVILDAHPVSLRSVGNFGLPLHSLCSNREVNETAAVQILKLLLDRHPEAVRHAVKYGNLPIHLAAIVQSSEFCRVLMEAYPGSEQVCDAYGRLPLHFACWTGTLSTVTYLYSLYPNGIDLATSNGRHPIHHAIDTSERDDPGHAVDIVKFLLGCGPDVKLQEYRGMSLLHYACLQRYDESNIEVGIQIIKVILDAHPTSLRCVDNFGRMPLQFLCNNRKVDQSAAVQILKLLLEKHPEAVRHTDNEGNLPIHFSAGTQSPEFCRVLMEAYPGSERISNNDGTFPLHLACCNNVEVVEYFCKLFPDAIHHVDALGHYPIHYAIGNCADLAALDVIQFLLDYDPNVKFQRKFQGQGGKTLLHIAFETGNHYDESNIEAALEKISTIYNVHPEAIEDNNIASDIQNFHQKVQAFVNSQLVYARQAKDRRLMITPDDNGQLPLHAAIQNNATLGSIKLLVKGNPDALRSPDNSGALPLHMACEHYDSTAAIQYLVGLDTRTLNSVDKKGDTALHYVCHSAKYDAIELLIEKHDSVSVSKRNAQNKLPIELLWESNAVKDRESLGYAENIYRLLKSYPEMLMTSSMEQPEPIWTQTGLKELRKFCDENEEKTESAIRQAVRIHSAEEAL